MRKLIIHRTLKEKFDVKKSFYSIISKNSNFKTSETFINKFIKLTTNKVNFKKSLALNSKTKFPRLTDMKISSKLSVSFSILILLFLIPISINLNYFNETVKLFTQTNETTIPEIYLVTSVSRDLKYIEKNLYASILTDNISKKEDYNELNKSLHAEMTKNLNELAGLLSTDQEKAEAAVNLLAKESKRKTLCKSF